jgi:hypothetical protein
MPPLRDRPEDILALVKISSTVTLETRQEDSKHRAKNDGMAAGLPLAGQYSRVAKRGAEGRHPLRRGDLLNRESLD